ncbi:PTS sugar transporter subunit IIB [Massilimicrobiota timonensis]|uniref:PTS sugar transporter subunit IIB n=1 Tax=Massilimicrobiota timonensis TaxID=1776392 RepID=UPI00101E0C1A|nr:hypothetical protein [Massilimicrobiota timonensis]
MFNVIVCCTSGMSSNLLASKMNKLILSKNYRISLHVCGLYMLETDLKVKPDIILLTPYVKYARRKIERLYKDIPILDISMEEYGTMDVEEILDRIWKELSQK